MSILSNIRAGLNRKRAAALQTLVEADAREKMTTESLERNEAHAAKRVAELSAKVEASGLLAKSSGVIASTRPNSRPMNMEVPKNYGVPARAASAAPVSNYELDAMKAENSRLQTRISNLEAAQAKATASATLKQIDYTALAKKVFGAEKVEAWARNSRDAETLSEHCAKVFYLESLSDIVPGISAESMCAQYGSPLNVSGLGRISHREKRRTTKAALATL